MSKIEGKAQAVVVLVVIHPWVSMRLSSFLVDSKVS